MWLSSSIISEDRLALAGLCVPVGSVLPLAVLETVHLFCQVVPSQCISALRVEFYEFAFDESIEPADISAHSKCRE